MTSYYWPTWADIVAEEIPESYNYGQSGGGNLFIANQVTEASIRHRFNHDDLVIIMWSSISREDRYKQNNWITPGNIYTQNYFDEKFVMEWADTRGYLIRDLAIITMCMGMLKANNVDYHMLNMAPFTDIQYSKPVQSIDFVGDVLNLYANTTAAIKPDLLTVACNGHWPQHPIRNNGGGQTADYHPSTGMHYQYLNDVFPGTEFKPETVNFVKLHESNVRKARDLNEFKDTWIKRVPPRL